MNGFSASTARADQDLMFVWGPGWGLNGMRLQPRVQPLKPNHDLDILEHWVDHKRL